LNYRTDTGNIYYYEAFSTLIHFIYLSERTQTPGKPGGSPTCSVASYAISKHLNSSSFKYSSFIFNVCCMRELYRHNARLVFYLCTSFKRSAVHESQNFQIQAVYRAYPAQKTKQLSVA